MTMRTCIVLLVGWPCARWITNRIQFCRGWIVIGHLAQLPGGNQSAGVVPLVVPGGAQLERVALELVPRVPAGSMASGVVALTALLARLVHMSVTVEVQLERHDKEQ